MQILLLEKHSKDKQKQLKIKKKKQVEISRTSNPTNKALTLIKYFILDKWLNPEALKELKRIEEQEQKVNWKKRFYKRYKNMILQNSKRYALFGLLLRVA